MKVSINLKKTLYLFSAVILVTDRFMGTDTSMLLRMIVAFCWTVVFFMANFRGNYSFVFNCNMLKHMKLIFGLYLGIFLYTSLIWFFNLSDVTFSNFTRLCSTILYTFLYVCFGCMGYNLFKNKAIDIIFWAAVLSYGIGSVLYSIVSCGITTLFTYVKLLFIGGADESKISYIMEVHGLTFLSGILFLFYLFFENKKVRHHKLKIILAGLLVFLGLKRIEIIALALAIIVYYLLLKGGRNIKFRALVCTIGSIIIASVFLYLIDSGLLYTLTSKYNIDTSGRISYYDYAKKYFDFDVVFFGTGFTWFSRAWQQLYYSGFRINGYGIAASVHSDLLTLFIELGFVMFYCWILYNLYFRTVYLGKHSNYKVSECYLLLTVFMFVLYLTDNTLTYYSVQMVYFLAPLMLENSNKKLSLK